MSSKVVRDHDVAGHQRRTEDLLDVGKEYVPVGGLFDGHGGVDSTPSHSGQNGHDLPMAAGRCFANAPTVGATGIKARHHCGNTALVQECQIFRRRCLEQAA